MLTGVERTDARIQEFEIQCQVGDAFVDVTNVRISPGIVAAITSNKVSMTAGHQDVRVDFDTIENCIGVKIWVYATDAGNSNLVLNELTVYGILASEKWSECSASCGRKGIQTRGLETKPCNQINCHFCSFNDDDCIVGFKCNNGNCEIDQGEIDLGEIDQEYVIVPSNGGCREGTELSEIECANLGDGGEFSTWADAGTWDLPETCGCYTDQNGLRYFNRLTGPCDNPNSGEQMICKKAEEDFVSYVMLDSDGECAPGTGLTEEECQNLGDGGLFSIWAEASTWSLPETCGCYIDQRWGAIFQPSYRSM
eukprot:UN22948